jgi:hypothetical protein
VVIVVAAWRFSSGRTVSVTVGSGVGPVVAGISVGVSMIAGSVVNSLVAGVTLTLSDWLIVSFTNSDEFIGSVMSVVRSADTAGKIMTDISKRRKIKVPTPRTPCMYVFYQSDIKMVWFVHLLKDTVFNKSKDKILSILYVLSLLRFSIFFLQKTGFFLSAVL